MHVSGLNSIFFHVKNLLIVDICYFCYQIHAHQFVDIEKTFLVSVLCNVVLCKTNLTICVFRYKTKYLWAFVQCYLEQSRVYFFKIKTLVVFSPPEKSQLITLFCLQRFLCEHQCKVMLSRQREETGPSRWTKAVFKCRNLDDQFVPTVICDKHCVNPLRNCRRLRKYRNEQVLVEVPVKSRNNVTTSVQIPVACQCVPRRSRRACSNRSQIPRRTDWSTEHCFEIFIFSHHMHSHMLQRYHIESVFIFFSHTTCNICCYSNLTKNWLNINISFCDKFSWFHFLYNILVDVCEKSAFTLCVYYICSWLVFC